MRYVVLLLVLCFSGVLYAQKGISICRTSSTEAFTSFASNEDFNRGHPEPLPFTYQSDIGEMITYGTPDGKTARAFLLSSPVSADDYLFVIHEWWGLNDYIKEEAEQYYNALGIVNVMALDLYDGKVATTHEEASSLMEQASDERIKAIIQGAIDLAGGGAEIASIGWCFGGGWSLQASIMAGDQAQGAVMYYGMPENDPQKIDQITFPVLGIFATEDTHITPQIVKKFEDNMQSAPGKLTVHFYEADHAFANPSNPHYDEEATEDAFQKSLIFLKRVLD